LIAIENGCQAAPDGSNGNLAVPALFLSVFTFWETSRTQRWNCWISGMKFAEKSAALARNRVAEAQLVIGTHA